MHQALSRAGVALASLSLIVFCCTGYAETYPEKPVRLVLPFPAGGPSDILGRALGQKLSEQLGENVVPDNHAGAGGNLGLALAAKAPPDGYTIVVASPTIAISPSLYAKLTYDANELTPISRLASIDNVLVVHPTVPAKTLRQFIKLARAHPGKLNFGSGGAGTTNHLANELLKNIEHINMVHVPYKGASQAALALIGGEVDEVIVAVASALPHIKSGRVRPLAVLSEKRAPTLPDVPTAAEAGVKNFNVSIWYGMYAPTGTPRDIVERLDREIVKALQSPDLVRRLDTAGVNPWPGNAEDQRKLEADEKARYAGIIKSIGLKIK